MTTKKRTISVRLEDLAKRRVERAARLLRQSSGAFLEKAGEERARQVLLEWALGRYRRSESSFSALAVEEIMEAAGNRGRDEALEMFLAGCRTVAETQGQPEFLQLGQKAVKVVTGTS